jgi:diguanylate cyclase (GGDEF)-like protein
MTTTMSEEVEFGSALAVLWQRHRQTNLDRISLLEATTASILRSTADDATIAEGVSTAHKLAGSLGTFGFDAGSRAALEAESLLREQTIDGALLAEAVVALRASIEEPGDSSEAVLNTKARKATAPAIGSVIKIVSNDADLISRLTVEATTIGLFVSSTTTLPLSNTLQENLPGVVVVDAAGTWSQPYLMKSLDSMAHAVSVVVLTDNDSWQERLAFARAGVAGVIPRSQGAHQMLAFVGEFIDRQNVAKSTMLAMNITDELLHPLRDATAGIDCSLEILDNPASLWMALEDRGADLLILGEAGQVSGSDVCRVIRAHPRWYRLPVVAIGEQDLVHLEDLLRAGADDYLSVRTPPRDLGTRLSQHVDRGRANHIRSDVDPFTGTENRTSAERSLERMLHIASNRDDPVAIALLTVDHFDRAREAGGNAMGDIVLRQLGNHLRASLRGKDVIGRWTHDGFALGFYGNTSASAVERITEASESFSAEVFSTTSGAHARYTLSAGVASSPANGSRLSSLVQLCESSLRRAKAGQNRIVTAGDRPSLDSPNIVDVVLIEDDDTVADVIEHALGLRDYTFVRFADGAEAVRELGEEHVKGKIVLLDIGLPSLDGFGVLQALRGQGVLDDSRVIMLTARSSENEMLRALGLGATEHITKPFSVPVLLGRLGPTLARFPS